jgi:hypothetical protein
MNRADLDLILGACPRRKNSRDLGAILLRELDREALAAIIAFPDMGSPELADELSIGLSACSAAVARLREKGLVFPSNSIIPLSGLNGSPPARWWRVRWLYRHLERAFMAGKPHTVQTAMAIAPDVTRTQVYNAMSRLGQLKLVGKTTGIWPTPDGLRWLDRQP